MPKVNTNIFRIAILALVILGCGRKSVQQESKSVETLTRDSNTMITEPKNIEFVLQPCDTNGIIRQFNFKDSTGGNVIHVFTDRDVIRLRIKRDTIRQIVVVKDSIRIEQDAKVITKEVPKTPGWAKWSIALNLFLLVVGYVVVISRWQ